LFCVNCYVFYFPAKQYNDINITYWQLTSFGREFVRHCVFTVTSATIFSVSMKPDVEFLTRPACAMRICSDAENGTVSSPLFIYSSMGLGHCAVVGAISPARAD